MKVLIAIAIVLAGASLAACGQKGGRSCIDKGRDFMIDNGSWPTMSDGRDARSVVAERCLNYNGAFDGME